MKFAFLLALLIALVAVSTATWTTTSPANADKWTPGAAVTLKFKTDAAVAVKDTFTITATSDSDEVFWNLDFAVHGAGAYSYCAVGTDAVATVQGSVVTFFKEVAANAEISCQVRVSHLATTDISVSVGAEEPKVVTITASTPKVEVTAATANDDLSTKVELKFSGLVANSVFGPVTFGYKFNQGEKAITAQTLFTAQFRASDYKSVVIGTDVRLLISNAEFWVVTAAAPVDSTTTIEYFSYELAGVISTDRTKAYSVWASIKDSKNADVKSTKEVGQVQSIRANTAQIQRATDGTISYGHSVTVKNAKPKFSFSISGFDADAIFATGATLKYIIGATSKDLDITTKAMEYELTDAVADDVVTVVGTFKATGDFTVLSKLESTIDDLSASAQLVVGAYVSDYAIGSLTDGVVDYTLTISPTPKEYKGEFEYDLTPAYLSSYFLQQLVGDVRASGEYSPSCTVEGASVSIGDKVTKDDADLNLRRMEIKGTLADNTKTHTVKCTQKVGTGERSSKAIVLNTKTKDIFTATATETYKQKVIVQAAAVTDAASFNTLLTNVIAALKAFDADKFDKLVAGDFHYTSDVQQYGSGVLGFDFKFDTFVDEFSNQGSSLTFGFTPTGADDTYVAANAQLYGAGWKYFLTGADTTAFKAAAVYLDGSVDATYTANQFVQHGLGVKCATTQQCAGAYCNKAVCTPYTQLTFAQQAAINQEDGSTSASSALFTGLALLLAVIAIFA